MIVDSVKNQMYNKARDIDVAIFNCLFYNENKMFVVYALSAFQNRDGGFGQGLYIDNYNRDSSIYTTYEALRILVSCNIDYNYDDDLFKEMIKKAFNYIYNKNKLVNNSYNPLVMSNDKSACANIFKYNLENINKFSYIPTLYIYAYTLRLSKVDSPFYKLAIKGIKYYLTNIIINSDDELIAYKYLYKTLVLKNEYISDLDNLNKVILNLEESMLNKDNVLYLYDTYTSNIDIDNLINEGLDDILASLKSHSLFELHHDWENDDNAKDMAYIKWLGQDSIKCLEILKRFNRG